jgi:XisH protein
VRNALVHDGWTITHDPLHLRWGTKDMYVDLGAERFLGAEKGNRKIAVEIKSFAGPSLMLALEQALGQFTLYDDVLQRIEPERTLYLAVSETIHHDLFEEPLGQLLLANGRLRLLVFTTKDEVIERWTPEPPTAR